MKIEMRLGEGERAVLVDGKPLDGVVQAYVTLTPNAAFVHLTLAPGMLKIAGEAGVLFEEEERKGL